MKKDKLRETLVNEWDMKLQYLLKTLQLHLAQGLAADHTP